MLQVAAILTLPFDVVKTQRQILLGEVDPLLGWYWNPDSGSEGDHMVPLTLGGQMVAWWGEGGRIDLLFLNDIGRCMRKAAAPRWPFTGLIKKNEQPFPVMFF